ncbi:hypothetical protein ACA910_005606 [Epithemia clementina (nom. ined.)]
MAGRSSPRKDEFVDHILQAFRRELDAHTEQLFSTNPGVASAARRAATTPSSMGQRSSERGLNGSGRHKRVVVDENPRFYDSGRSGGEMDYNDDLDEEPLPPVQTPYASSSSAGNERKAPPLSRGTPPPPPQMSSVYVASNSDAWKASMNHILDTIEVSEKRADTLARENAELSDKVDILARDFASLQQDFVDQQRELKDVKGENEDLKKAVQDLRQTMGDTKAQLEAENEELRVQLREARNERDVVERHNDKLHDRIRELELQLQHQQLQRVSSSRLYSNKESPAAGGDNEPRRYYYRGGGDNVAGSSSSSNPHGGYSSAEERRTPGTSSSASRRRYERDDPYSRRRSPGEELVRELAEKTPLDADELAPLSDILDKRLGRATSSAAAAASEYRSTPSSSASASTYARRNPHLYDA